MNLGSTVRTFISSEPERPEIHTDTYLELYVPAYPRDIDQLSQRLAALFLQTPHPQRPHGYVLEGREKALAFLLSAALSAGNQFDVEVRDMATERRYTTHVVPDSALAVQKGNPAVQLGALIDPSNTFAPTEILIHSEAAVQAAQKFQKSDIRRVGMSKDREVTWADIPWMIDSDTKTKPYLKLQIGF